MKKLNYMVEVEICGQWVHTYCSTLVEAQALLKVLEASQDAIYEEICDADIYLTDDATKQAQAEHSAYRQAKINELAEELGISI
jgi:hypothetical protein